MAKIGKVLWWDRRDREGIIVDGAGNQYYFNHSVIAFVDVGKINDGQYVEFEISALVPYVSCAKDVHIVAARAVKRAEERFFEQRQLDLGGV